MNKILSFKGTMVINIHTSNNNCPKVIETTATIDKNIAGKYLADLAESFKLSNTENVNPLFNIIPWKSGDNNKFFNLSVDQLTLSTENPKHEIIHKIDIKTLPAELQDVFTALTKVVETASSRSQIKNLIILKLDHYKDFLKTLVH